MDDWFGLQRGLVAVGLLAAIPGCSDPDKDNTTGTDPGSTGDNGTTSTSSTTSGDTSGDTPTGTGSATGTTGEGTTGEPTSTTGEATTGEATTGEATTGGVEIPPVCQSYGAKVAECYMDPMAGMEAAQYCAIAVMTYETYGPDCVQANEAWLACLSALPCAEFTGPDPVCEAELATLESACVMP